MMKTIISWIQKKQDQNQTRQDNTEHKRTNWKTQEHNRTQVPKRSKQEQTGTTQKKHVTKNNT